jgi:hypothetical protein
VQGDGYAARGVAAVWVDQQAGPGLAVLGHGGTVWPRAGATCPARQQEPGLDYPATFRWMSKIVSSFVTWKTS